MSWARFDDLYDDNRKIKRAWRRNRAAVGLHAMSVTYCARHETDGLVDIDWIEEKLPNAKERDAVLKVLVDGGLFNVVDDEHYEVHDYLEFHDSAADRERKREEERRRKSEAGKKGAAKRWGKQTDSTCHEGANGSGSQAVEPSIAPDPTRPYRYPPWPPASGG